MKFLRASFLKLTTPSSINALLICLAFIAILPKVLPLIGTQTLSGWDTQGHLAMVEQMAAFLKQGKFSGYVTEWEGGFPAFVLYPPLFFIVTALPSVLIPSLSPATCFQIIVFVMPFLFLLSFLLFARTRLDQKNYLFAPFLAALFLLLPHLGAFGVGLPALLGAGLVPSFFGLIIFCFVAFLFDRLQQTNRWCDAISCGTALAALILSHLLSSIFCALYLLILICLEKRASWSRLVVLLIIALLLSAWWTIPFVQSLGLSSGQALFSRESPTPLTIFFPIGEYIPNSLVTGALEVALKKFEFPLSSSLFSPQLLVGLFLLLTVSVGVVTCIRHQRLALPAIFIIGLLLVPGDFLWVSFGLPVHSYRFAAPLWLIELILAAEGLREICSRINPKDRALNSVLIGIGLILCAFTWGNFYQLTRSNSLFVYRVEERQQFKAGEELLAFLADHRPTGRIAVESSLRSNAAFGSPHWPLIEIPRRLHIPVMPGLYAESSLSSPFITPILATLGEQIPWGAPEILRRDSFRRQPTRLLVERLREFSIENIVASSPKLRRKLQRCRRCGIEKTFDNRQFALYRLKQFSPIIDIPKFKPFIFIDKGGLDFRAMTKFFYTSKKLFEIPLIFSPRGIEDLAPEDREVIAGVMVSCDRNTKLSADEIDQWAQFGKVVTLNCLPTQVSNTKNQVLIVPYLFRDFHLELFAKQIKPWLLPLSRMLLPQQITDTPTELSFISHGITLLRYNYAKCWKEINTNKPIFFANPSFMAVLGKVKFNLKYGC